MSNIDDVFLYLNELDTKYPYGYYFTSCFEVDNYIINYKNVIYILSGYYSYIEYKEIVENPVEFKIFNTTDYNCQICFDTKDSEYDTYKTNCGHHFHKSCLVEHCENNNKLCPMCRTDIEVENEEKTQHNSEWLINPLTKRKIKKGGKTYQELKQQGVLE